MQAPNKIKQIFNRWQLASFLSGANRKVHITGRGGGKTFLLGADGWKLARAMPRGLFFICTDTFDRIRNSTAPAMLTAWEILGWKEYDPATRQGHYVINKQPPAHWPKPYFARLSAENTIFTYTGAAFKFISQAAKNARGQSFDGGLIDEGLTLKRSFIDSDLLPVLRGNTTRFKTPLHFSTTTVSSMPWDASGEYLLEAARYYEDDNKGYAELHAKLPHLYAAYLDAQTDAERHRQWHYEIIPVLQKLIYYVSKDGVYYSQATVFDNLDQFSWNTLKAQWRDIDRTSFMIEFLNMRYEAIGDQFYYTLNEAKHCYDPDDINAQGELSLITSAKGLLLPAALHTSKHDKDVDPDRPLDMSGDWQASIIPLVIGQKVKHNDYTEYRVLKDLFVKSPDWIDEAIDKFAAYYTTHRNKTVRLVYDHTAIGKHSTDKSVIDRIATALKRNGWKCQRVYIGKQPEHQERFTLINTALEEKGERAIRVRFNRANTQTLRLAMRCTTVMRSGSTGFSKDKTKEKSANYPQERTTHFTDALDTLLLAVLKNTRAIAGGYVPPVVSGTGA